MKAQKLRTVDATAVVVRFLVGAVVGGILVMFTAIFGLAPLWLGIALPVTLGALTVFFGDRFLGGVLRMLRWFY